MLPIVFAIYCSIVTNLSYPSMMCPPTQDTV